MSLRAVVLGTTCLAVLCAAAPVSAQSDGNPVVVIETSVGNITVELFRDKAPLSVANFLSYMGGWVLRQHDLFIASSRASWFRVAA